MEFLKINNRNNFLLSEVPIINPFSRRYTIWWKLNKKRCIEGFWSIDDKDVKLDIVDEKLEFPKSNKWRYMPPTTYFYANFGTILRNKKGTTSGAKQLMRPSLDDVEWEFGYNWIEARGFSGFEFDREYSCNRFLLGDYTDEELVGRCLDENGEIIQLLYNNFFKVNGDRKKYIPVRKYIRQLFTEQLGRPIYGNIPKNLMILGTRDGGKMLHTQEKVRIQNGWKAIGDLKIGDEIYGGDGKLCKVINTTSIQKNLNMYKITLRDGRTIEACEDHTWKVWDKNKNRNSNGINPFTELTTKQLFKSYYNERIDSKYRNKTGKIRYVKEPKYAIPSNCSLLDEKTQNLPLHPYVVGCLLGDGSLTQNTIVLTNIDKELLNRFEKLLPADYFLKPAKNGKDYYIAKLNDTVKPFRELCSDIDIYDKIAQEKSIPEAYLFSDENSRMELLRGLMDTDGFADNRHIEYCTISPELANNVVDLVRSLGINCTIKKSKAGYKKDGIYIECNDRYRISIYTDKPIFSLNRKLQYILPEKKARGKSRFDKTFITNIEPCGKADGVCIMVDNKDHTYITKDYIVTHNSYLVGNQGIAHELLFDGMRYYNTNDPLEGKAIAEIVVGAAISDKSRDLLTKVKYTFDNLPGVWKKGTAQEIPCPFYKHMKGSTGANKEFYHGYQIKQGNDWKDVSGSFIKHRVFTTENPEAAAGGRPGTIVLEEVGLIGNLLSIHSSNDAAQNDGGEKFGSTLYIGTAGNIEKILEPEIIFNDPKSFDFLEFDNIWEESNNKICWFIPAHYMARKFKDENGNTKVEEALNHFLKRRESKRNGSSKKNLDGELMNYPLKPSEMFINKTNNKFPIADVKIRIRDLMSQNNDELKHSYKGFFSIDENGNVRFDNNDKLRPIREFPLTKDDVDLTGCPEMFEPPIKNAEGLVPKNIYGAAMDPVDDDGNDDSGQSLQSFYIMNLLTDRIVFEYTARTKHAKEFYEQVRRALLYYNATLLYENQKKGLYTYFDQKNSLFLLEDTPQALKDAELQKGNFTGNRSKGVYNTPKIKYWGEQELLPAYLDSKAYNGEGEQTNLHILKSLGALREMIYYTGKLTNGKKTNTDRISSLGLLMILRELKLKHKTDIVKKRKKITDDPFFNRHSQYSQSELSISFNN